MGTMRIAFQGTAGAYSEEALLKVFPEAKPVGFPTFHQVFEAVEAGEAELGVVPVENTTAGSINQTYDLLLESDLHVVGEIVHRVEHCLLAPKGTTLKDLHAVKSHPQALAQCDGFLARMRLTPIPVFDTAGAAKELAEHPEPGLAAIASRRAAELYGSGGPGGKHRGLPPQLHPLLRHRAQGAPEGPGALQDEHRLRRPAPARGAFGGAFRLRRGGVNLTKLESRPRRDKPFSYLFYLDLEGHLEDPGPAQALLRLLRRVAFLKVLGSYPAHANGGVSAP